jgi:hypothetical protein
MEVHFTIIIVLLGVICIWLLFIGSDLLKIRALLEKRSKK